MITNNWIGLVTTVLRVGLTFEWTWALWVFYPAVRRARHGLSDTFDLIATPFFFLAFVRFCTMWSGMILGPPPVQSGIDEVRRLMIFALEIAAVSWMIAAKLKIRSMR